VTPCSLCGWDHLWDLQRPLCSQSHHNAQRTLSVEPTAYRLPQVVQVQRRLSQATLLVRSWGRCRDCTFVVVSARVCQAAVLARAATSQEPDAGRAPRANPPVAPRTSRSAHPRTADTAGVAKVGR